jgi:hypothetical protein
MNDHNTELGAEDQRVGEMLTAMRPAPTLGLRTTLGRRLAGTDPGYGHRPAQLWARAGALAGAGTLLVLCGLLVSTGAI